MESEKIKSPTVRFGVIIQHGCGRKVFLSKKTLEEMCLILCPKCGNMINLSMFDSTIKKQLLEKCREISKEEIAKRIK